ncbi:MAG: acyl carrier protein [Phreatobacter sp.]|uniref:acyl carrier protein n=1 Tax=Phreatobacter sp. TaxID=1966341 RepID=UPI0027331B95|nr:acyl carrier protein [Phreatobacter sp.]MDP2801979.1 acyl carrier protein [Phreatobacter sp.]
MARAPEALSLMVSGPTDGEKKQEGHGMTDTASAFGDDQLTRDLIEVIAKEGMVDLNGVGPETTLESLNIASVDFMMILAAIEEKFQVYVPMDENLSQVKDVGGLIAVFKEHIQKSQQA